MNQFKEKLHELKARLAVRSDCQEELAILESILSEEKQYVIIPTSKFLPCISYKTEKSHQFEGCAYRTIEFKVYSKDVVYQAFIENPSVIEAVDRQLYQNLIDYLESEK
jgi:hypothetical protein